MDDAAGYEYEDENGARVEGPDTDVVSHIAVAGKQHTVAGDDNRADSENARQKANFTRR